MIEDNNEEIKTILLLKNGLNNAKTPKIIDVDIAHQGMSSPNGTLPNINMIPAIKSKVASKFLILKALYDAEATKKASKANIVADKGVKIVKNKVAPPFRFTELEIAFGKGISYEGDLIDLATEFNIIDKSGTWYSFNGERMGQGKESAKKYLAENTKTSKIIEEKVKEQLKNPSKKEAAKK